MTICKALSSFGDVSGRSGNKNLMERTGQAPPPPPPPGTVPLKNTPLSQKVLNTEAKHLMQKREDL